MTFSVSDLAIEAWLVRLETEHRERVVTLTFRRDGQEFSLRCDGVDSLKLTDYYEQNILDDIRQYDVSRDAAIIQDVLAHLLFDVEAAAELENGDRRAELMRCLHALSTGNRILLELVPVIGARGFVLAESVSWVGVSETRTP